MARIRSIKPDFFLDEDLPRISCEARLLFIGLWCLADKDGRLEDRPMKIKIQVFPYENVEIESLLEELASGSKPFIVRYTVNGHNYIQIINFQKHQRPHHTEPSSSIPELNGEATVRQLLDNGESRVGREGKGKEGKGNIKESEPTAQPSAATYSQELVDKAKEASDLGFNVYQQVAMYNKGKCNRIPESVMLEILTEFFEHRGKINDIFPYMARVIQEKSRRFWSNKNVAEHEAIKKGPVSVASVLRQLAGAAI